MRKSQQKPVIIRETRLHFQGKTDIIIIIAVIVQRSSKLSTFQRTNLSKRPAKPSMRLKILIKLKKLKIIKILKIERRFIRKNSKKTLRRQNMRENTMRKKGLIVVVDIQQQRIKENSRVIGISIRIMMWKSNIFPKKQWKIEKIKRKRLKKNR